MGYPTGSPPFAPLCPHLVSCPTNPQPRRLRPIGCELVGWYVSGSHQCDRYPSLARRTSSVRTIGRDLTCLNLSPTPDQMTGVQLTSREFFSDTLDNVWVHITLSRLNPPFHPKLIDPPFKKSLSVSPECNPCHGHQL